MFGGETFLMFDIMFPLEADNPLFGAI